MTDLVTLVTLVTNCLSDDDSPEERDALNEALVTLGVPPHARRDIFRAADLRRRTWRRSRNLSAARALALVTAPGDRYAQARRILHRRDDRHGVMVPAGVAHRYHAHTEGDTMDMHDLMRRAIPVNDERYQARAALLTVAPTGAANVALDAAQTTVHRLLRQVMPEWGGGSRYVGALLVVYQRDLSEMGPEATRDYYEAALAVVSPS